MDRNEAKKLMRVEMESFLSKAEQEEHVYKYQGRLLNAIDICDESEKEPETPLGKAFVDDFIEFKEGKHTSADHGAAVLEDPKFKALGLEMAPVPELTAEQVALTIKLMKEDLDLGGDLFGNRVLYTEKGVKWTPYMLFKEVQDGTPYGLAYARTFLDSHEARQDLMVLAKALGLKVDQLATFAKNQKTDSMLDGTTNLFGFGNKNKNNDQKN